jgi:hypothetical protein
MHTPVAPSRLLAHVERLTAAQPHTRKRLVAPDLNFGRELLTALARRTGGWIGWEATTIRGIADALAFVPLAERGRRAANDVEIGDLVSAAFDACRADGLLSAGFAAHGRSAGFRTALLDTMLEVRTAGLAVESLLLSTSRAGATPDLAQVLQRYIALLSARSLVDPAGVFQAALDAFEREAPFVLDGLTTLSPALALRGLPGALVARLVDRGAVILDCDVAPDTARTGTLLSHADTHTACSTLAWACATSMPGPVTGAPDATLCALDLFVAATPTDELREVCRRVLSEGLQWDEVEIVATDPDTYGIALDALAQQCGIRVSMLRGVPLAQTRLGRALEHWLVWLRDGLPADLLRESLEAGEIASPDAAIHHRDFRAARTRVECNGFIAVD